MIAGYNVISSKQKGQMIDHVYALPEGYRLQEYTITGTLGFGGFGIAYSAHDNNLDKGIAIKEYLPAELAARVEDSTVSVKSQQDKETFDWGLERFLDEARTVAKFDHPNIVRIYRFFEQNGTGYIVMEFLDGQTLDWVLKQRKTLEESEIRHWLWPVIKGLQFVHEKGYLHRDIKPQNIIMRGDGRPCLLDFGAARLAMGNRTRPLTSIMTPGFAPLEQYQSQGQGPWTDIYALGAVMYKCVSGSKPRNSLDRIADDSLEAPDSGSENTYSPGLINGIAVALRINAKDRPKSLQAWLQILDGADESTTRLMPDKKVSQATVTRPKIQAKAVEMSAETPIPEDKPRSGRWLLLAAPVLLIVAAIGYWYAVIKPEAMQMARKPATQAAEALVEPGPQREPEPELVLEPEPITGIPQEPPAQLTAQEATLEEPAPKGVKVTSQPPGAEIFIEGAYVGVTPLQLSDLEGGQTVSVRLELTGFQPQEQAVRVPHGHVLDLNWILAKNIDHFALTIEPDPPDATIKILNIKPAYQPGMLMESGQYHVEVSAPGYNTQSRWIELKDRALIARIELEQDERWLSEEALIDRDRQGQTGVGTDSQDRTDSCKARCASMAGDCQRGIPSCEYDASSDCTNLIASALTCGGDPNCIARANEQASDCRQQAQAQFNQCQADRNTRLAQCEFSTGQCQQSCG